MVKSSLNGREQILQFLGPGEVFHGIGVFVDRPAPATAIALEPTELWLLPRSAITQCLTENPALALQIIESLADRINQLVTLVADLSLRSVIERLARLLLDEAIGDTLHPWLARGRATCACRQHQIIEIAAVLRCVGQRAFIDQ